MAVMASWGNAVQRESRTSAPVVLPGFSRHLLWIWP